jgi:hypothetical protein
MAPFSLRAARKNQVLSSFRAQPACEQLEERRLLAADPLLGELNAAVLATSHVADPQTSADLELQPVASHYVGDGAAEAALGSVSWGGRPVVAGNATGNYVAVWYGTLPGGAESDARRLYAQKFDGNNEPVGDPIVVDDSGPIVQYKVGMAADGSFVVAWTAYGFLTPSAVLIQRFDADQQAVGDHIQVDAGQPQPEVRLQIGLQTLSLNRDGSFVIGYTISESRVRSDEFLSPSWIAGPSQGFLQRYDGSGARVGSAIALGQSSPVGVAIAPDGSFVVLTFASASKGPVVHLFNADGSSRGAPIRVSYLDGYASSPQIAMDASGNFVVAWLRDVAGEKEILAQRFDASGRLLRNAITVVSADSESAPLDNELLLAMGPDGSFLVGWTAGYHGVIYMDLLHSTMAQVAAAFDPTGKPLGMVYQASNAATVTGFAAGALGQWIISSAWRTYSGERIYVDTYALPSEIIVDLNGEPPGIGYEGNFIPGGAPVDVGNRERLLIHSAGWVVLASATVTIHGYRAGDLLTVDASDTSLTVSFSDGVLTLSGASSVADYQKVLRTVQFSTTADRQAGETVSIGVVIFEGSQTSDEAVSKISIHVPGRTSIVGRHIFYNNSAFDGNDPAVNAGDNAAIATDKTALLPGQTATFANYTSYTRGINGVIIDLSGEHGNITADDFVFRVGNLDDTSNWAYAPLPQSVSVWPGPDGVNRVKIIWADGEIKNVWLQVIVLANGNTGLAQSDSFFFGNRIGDTGNEPQQARTTTTDVMRAVNRILADPTAQTPAAIDSSLDFNRDGRITTHDVMIAVNQILQSTEPLDLITVNASSAQAGAVTAAVIFSSIVPVEHSVYVSTGLIASPQAAVFQAWDSQDEELEFRLPESTPTLLMTAPDSV